MENAFREYLDCCWLRIGLYLVDRPCEFGFTVNPRWLTGGTDVRPSIRSLLEMARGAHSIVPPRGKMRGRFRDEANPDSLFVTNGFASIL
jgi:hypothetical protein